MGRRSGRPRPREARRVSKRDPALLSHAKDGVAGALVVIYRDLRVEGSDLENMSDGLDVPAQWLFDSSCKAEAHGRRQAYSAAMATWS